MKTVIFTAEGISEEFGKRVVKILESLFDGVTAKSGHRYIECAVEVDSNWEIFEDCESVVPGDFQQECEGVIDANVIGWWWKLCGYLAFDKELGASEYCFDAYYV